MAKNESKISTTDRIAFTMPTHDWNQAWKDAARDGDVFSLTRMINNGQSIDAQAPDTGFTALHTAASNDQHAVVQALLRAGADVNIETLATHPCAQLASMTPLKMAQWHRRTAVIPLLAAASRANPELTASDVETRRAQAIEDYEAKYGTRRDVLKADKVLIHAAEWKSAALAGDVASLRNQLGEGQNIDQRNMCGLTALHFAAKPRNGDAVEFLLSQGADATLRTYPGEAMPNMTALDMFLHQHKIFEGRVVELLRSAETRSPNTVSDAPSHDLPSMMPVTQNKTMAAAAVAITAAGITAFYFY